ncbi:MAG: serine protease [Thiotrichales bacterium]|mgnify:FL=1|nr:serine protease [Thiotrichales bacterium]|tara:strand:- start:202 stop:1056 length:855 start_codon:yes stop_codon:yes gene_type:complete
MNRFLDRLAYLAAIFALLYASSSYLRFPQEEETRRPSVRYAEPAPDARAPAVAPGGQVVTIQVPEKQPSTGTAFAIGGGWWLTARHVADGCDAIGLVTGPRKAARAQQVVIHPNADLALLSLRLDPEPFAFLDESLRRGQDGFAIGYPQGSPGDVHAQLMGRVRLKSVGRYRTDEPILAWAERSRVPDSLPALGGLSGGPMFNARGQVIGVLVAASERRGRVMTSDPTSVRWLLDQAGLVPDPDARPIDLAVSNFVGQGDDLRDDLRVAKVLCDVKQSSRRRRL